MDSNLSPRRGYIVRGFQEDSKEIFTFIFLLKASIITGKR
jgi:hypothetical protein